MSGAVSYSNIIRGNEEKPISDREILYMKRSLKQYKKRKCKHVNLRLIHENRQPKSNINLWCGHCFQVYKSYVDELNVYWSFYCLRQLTFDSFFVTHVEKAMQCTVFVFWKLFHAWGYCLKSVRSCFFFIIVETGRKWREANWWLFCILDLCYRCLCQTRPWDLLQTFTFTAQCQSALSRCAVNRSEVDSVFVKV